MDNIYLRLTREFNNGRLRAVISSGQAVVLHRLAIMSKDGDWILKEDEEACQHVLQVISGYGAKYRFGAPLDVKWLSGGWSSHFEFQHKQIRVRTDFFSRPPRLSHKDLKEIWQEQEGKELPYLNVRHLAEIKKTNREKDYVVIGELARRMNNPRDQILYSRSARDLLELAKKHPDLLPELKQMCPLLTKISEGRESLEAVLDAERRGLIRTHEARLSSFIKASQPWASRWKDVQRLTQNLPLVEAHPLVVKQAESLLPFALEKGS